MRYDSGLLQATSMVAGSLPPYSTRPFGPKGTSGSHSLGGNRPLFPRKGSLRGRWGKGSYGGTSHGAFPVAQHNNKDELPTRSTVCLSLYREKELTHPLSPRPSGNLLSSGRARAACSPCTPTSPFSLGLCLQVTPPSHLPGILNPHVAPCCHSLQSHESWP